MDPQLFYLMIKILTIQQEQSLQVLNINMLQFVSCESSTVVEAYFNFTAIHESFAS